MHVTVTPQFQFRVWIRVEDPSDVETWYHCLTPVDKSGLSIAEWAHMHLVELDLHDVFGLDKSKNWQVVGRGTIRGEYDHFGEYSEEFTCDEYESVEVPDSWF